MLYTQTDPPLPSITRWVRLCRQYPQDSPLRKLEYEHLTTLPFAGEVLDVGGGSNAHYLKHLPSGINYHSINIDPTIEPTWLVDVGEKFPIENETFDYCLSMNTLEHVYDPQFLISEMYRTLKKGGRLYLTVPWMFRIHGHPDDFHRMTPSWWQKTLQDIGFQELNIMPLVWGRSSSGNSIAGRRGIRKHFAHVKDAVYANCFIRGNKKRIQRICNVAMGHFLIASK